MHVGRFVTAGVPRLGRGKRSRSPKTRSKQGTQVTARRSITQPGSESASRGWGRGDNGPLGEGEGLGALPGGPEQPLPWATCTAAPAAGARKLPASRHPVPEPRLRPTPTWDARLSLPSRPRHCHSPGGRAGNGTDLTESGNCAPSLTGPSKLPSVCSGNGDVVTTRTPGSWGGGCGKSGAERPGSSRDCAAPPPAPTPGLQGRDRKDTTTSRREHLQPGEAWRAQPTQ